MEDLKAIGIVSSRRGAHPTLCIANDCATAEISLYGAQMLSFIPRGEKDLLFLSQQAVFEEGKAIRGGIPVCWPWFGVAGKPSHGVARLSMWQLADARLEADGTTKLVLVLDKRDFCGLMAELRIQIGRSLSLLLTTDNCGTQSYMLSEALHTYFAVGDIRQTTLSGLAPEDVAAPLEDGRMHFAAETDLVATPGDKILVIDDPVKARKIRIRRFDSASAVIWNPWIEKSQRLTDFGDGEYRKMLCVEAANVKEKAIALAPGNCHTLGVEISLLAD